MELIVELSKSSVVRVGGENNFHISHGTIEIMGGYFKFRPKRYALHNFILKCRAFSYNIRSVTLFNVFVSQQTE